MRYFYISVLFVFVAALAGCEDDPKPSESIPAPAAVTPDAPAETTPTGG